MQEPENWVNYEQVLGLKNNLRHYDYDVAIIKSSTSTNILWPGEQPVYTAQLVNNNNASIQTKGKIDIIRYGTIGIPNNVWLPQMVKFKEVESIPISVDIPANGYTNIELSPNIPSTFGGYAIIFDLGKYGRRLMCSVARTFKADLQPRQFPKQSLDDMDPEFLYRLGVKAIRMGIDYIPTTDQQYEHYMKELENKLIEYKKRNITVLLMFGAGNAEMPLHMPRSFLDNNNVMLKTKQDFVWLPSCDLDFKKFVNHLCVQYGWPKGPVTAVSLWNEPWEGISISGWQSDILRYREIYRVMADAVIDARAKGAEVLVGGGDSSSNAWDKLFADGKMTFLPIFDFCSIHYQGMECPSTYPEWVNRKSPMGRVRIWDTESWVGNTDDRIGLVIATNRSAGYDRSMGIYAGYLYSGGRGSEKYKQKIFTANGIKEIDKTPSTWSQTAAVGAIQHFVGDRDFNSLLFKHGLPWIMLFDGYNNDKDDGTAVVCGDIGDAFGAEQVLFRNVRGLSEVSEKEHIRELLSDKSLSEIKKDSLLKELQTYHSLSGGQMILPADSSFILYDFYGNQIKSENGHISIPLNAQGYYLRTNGSKGSFSRLLKALKTARIDGYEPVEIIAHDMTCRIENKPIMYLQVTNILNRPIKGKLHISLEGLTVKTPSQLNLEPHQVLTLPVKITGGKPALNNTYALRVSFDAGSDGLAVHYENMHVNLISKLPIHVDGKLEDWSTALPQILTSKGKENVSLTEAAWYPFVNFDTRANGSANGYLAYDDKYFYFAAKVADNTPHEGSFRFENRPDDTFFYPDTAFVMDMNKSLIAKEGNINVGKNDIRALELPSGDGRILHYWESGDNTNSYGLDIHLPENKYTKVSFYFPNINVSNALIEIYDATSGRLLAQHKIDKLWDGIYAVFNLSGKIRVVVHSSGWWYTVKLAGMFFDKTAEDSGGNKAVFVKEDLDTQGNWKNIYGEMGYYIVGVQPQLSDGISIFKVNEEHKTPLIWPAGIRHFTYRKSPVTPDNSGLGELFDNVLIAFNVIPEGKDGMLANPPGTMPRYIGYKCTDYEFALNQVASAYGGGTEIWRLLAPGLNRKHFFPRQPKSEKEGPVNNGKLVINREGNTLIYECAIPWVEFPEMKKALEDGKKIKFSFRVNDNGAPGSCLELAKDRSVSKVNFHAFHPDWKTHWANEIEFSFEK